MMLTDGSAFGSKVASQQSQSFAQTPHLNRLALLEYLFFRLQAVVADSIQTRPSS